MSPFCRSLYKVQWRKSQGPLLLPIKLWCLLWSLMISVKWRWQNVEANYSNGTKLAVLNGYEEVEIILRSGETWINQGILNLQGIPKKSDSLNFQGQLGHYWSNHYFSHGARGNIEQIIIWPGPDWSSLKIQNVTFLGHLVLRLGPTIISPWRGGLVEKSQLSHILAQPRIWDEIDLGGNEGMNSEAIILREENANEGLDRNDYDEDQWRLNTTEVQS